MGSGSGFLLVENVLNVFHAARLGDNKEMSMRVELFTPPDGESRSPIPTLGVKVGRCRRFESRDRLWPSFHGVHIVAGHG